MQNAKWNAALTLSGCSSDQVHSPTCVSSEAADCELAPAQLESGFKLEAEAAHTTGI